jgi:hypothetical protein
VDIFPRDRAITRRDCAEQLGQSDEWALPRRDMQLEGLQTLGDTAPARLPAVRRCKPRASQRVRAVELHHAMGHDRAQKPSSPGIAELTVERPSRSFVKLGREASP